MDAEARHGWQPVVAGVPDDHIVVGQHFGVGRGGRMSIHVPDVVGITGCVQRLGVVLQIVGPVAWMVCGITTAIVLGRHHQDGIAGSADHAIAVGAEIAGGASGDLIGHAVASDLAADDGLILAVVRPRLLIVDGAQLLGEAGLPRDAVDAVGERQAQPLAGQHLDDLVRAVGGRHRGVVDVVGLDAHRRNRMPWITRALGHGQREL